MTHNSVTGVAGLQEGERVVTGQLLDYEDDVGCAHTIHLHFEVARPNNPGSDDFFKEGGFIRKDRAQNLLPRVCGISGSQYRKATTYVVGNLVPGRAKYAYHGATEARYQALWDEARNCGYRLVWVDGYTDNGAPEFNLIFRPNPSGISWRSHRSMSGAEYQQRFDEYGGQDFRLTHVDSYLVGNSIRYAAVWEKSPGPQTVAYHGLNTAQHEARLDELVAAGYRPRVITPVSLGGVRRITALYQKTAVGSFEARSFLTPSEYQATFNANSEAGHRFVYLNAYTHDGAPRFAAIWWARPAVSTRAQHGLTFSRYQTAWSANLSAGISRGRSPAISRARASCTPGSGAAEVVSPRAAELRRLDKPTSGLEPLTPSLRVSRRTPGPGSLEPDSLRFGRSRLGQICRGRDISRDTSRRRPGRSRLRL